MKEIIKRWSIVSEAGYTIGSFTAFRDAKEYARLLSKRFKSNCQIINTKENK